MCKTNENSKCFQRKETKKILKFNTPTGNLTDNSFTQDRTNEMGVSELSGP